MLLGDMIRDLTDERNAAEALMALGDLPMVAAIEQARAPHGESAGAYAAGAVARFADHAGDEDWLALMNTIERTDDPASACLRAMIAWSLKDEAQDGHAGCTCGQEHPQS
jgi:hypothetical protein